MKLLTKLISATIWLALLTSNSIAADIGVDCEAINQDFTSIEKLIDSGEFRFVNKVKNADLPKFSFSADRPFSEYLNYTRTLINLKNPRANQPCFNQTETYKQLALINNWPEMPDIRNLLAPFELAQKDKSTGILLIHGLSDSPYHLHDLAWYFYNQGFSVRTLLLPGHATAPSDLIDVTYKQWQQAADYGINQMLKDYDQVYLGGFSTGGALIFNHLMQQETADIKIKGILLWSPASKIFSEMAWALKYINWVPFLDWLDKEADADFAKYESFPVNAGAQVHELMKQINGENDSAIRYMQNIPLFVVASEVDQTISTSATLKLMAEWHNPDERPNTTYDTLVYYGQPATVKAALPKTVKQIIPVCKGGEVCDSVLNVAHTGTTNAPTNPHYGVNSLYRNCSHYIANMELYKQCKQRSDVIVGEKTEDNLNLDEPLQRVTYNPYFAEMLESITEFLQVTR